MLRIFGRTTLLIQFMLAPTVMPPNLGFTRDWQLLN
jgi:hypothetical protein